MHTSNQTKRGVTALEVLVGVSIAAMILIAASFSIVTFINTSHAISEKTQALYLAEDGLELVRYVRDNDWANISSLTVENEYYLETTASTVDIGTNPEIVGDFSRAVVFENVYRHGSTHTIVASTTAGSIEDIETKYVTVTISGGDLTQDLSLTSILANIDS